MKKVREINLLKSMSINGLIKPISVTISLLYTPVLLKYLGSEQYGIWFTLLSIINWFTIFDFGISGGFRNLLTKSLPREDKEEIKRICSTAYLALGTVVILLFVLTIAPLCFLDWNNLFNTTLEVKPALLFILLFFCFNFIFGLTNSIIYANQRAHYVSIISLLVQLLNFISVYVLCRYKLVYYNELTSIALMYFMCCVFVNIAVLVWIWANNYKYRPNIHYFNNKYLKQICNYGIKLFLLQACAIVLFSTDNMIITHLFSPSQVTPYSITHQCFNAVNSFFVAIITPFLSRYTVEESNHNYSWIRRSFMYQGVLWGICFLGMFVLAFSLNYIYNIWLGGSINVPTSLAITMCFTMASMMLTSVFSNFLNGIGHIDLQLVVSAIAAIMNIPLSIYFAKNMGLGTTGVCLATLICQLFGCVFLPLDTFRFIKRREQECQNTK